MRVRGLWQPVCWQNHSGDIPSRGVGLRAPSLAGHQARAGFAPGGPSRRVQSSPVPLPRRPWLRPCQLSASSARESSGFKGLCYRVGPARVIQGTLPVLMPASFVSDAKLPPLIIQRFHGFPGLRHGRLRGLFCRSHLPGRDKFYIFFSSCMEKKKKRCEGNIKLLIFFMDYSNSL